MVSNQKLIRYEEEIQLESFGSTCIKAENLYYNINKEIKKESQVMTGFITVNEFSKNLKRV